MIFVLAEHLWSIMSHSLKGLMHFAIKVLLFLGEKNDILNEFYSVSLESHAVREHNVTFLPWRHHCDHDD